MIKTKKTLRMRLRQMNIADYSVTKNDSAWNCSVLLVTRFYDSEPFKQFSSVTTLLFVKYKYCFEIAENKKT